MRGCCERLMIEVNIHKPLYDNFVNIREKYILEAINRGEPLRIIIPQGSAVVDPRWWMKNGKRVEQVFKIPDRPMVLWGNYVPLRKSAEEKSLDLIKNGTI